MSPSDEDSENLYDPGNCTNTPGVVCRGCLKECGVMKNMYQWGLDVDFFKYTDIPRNSADGLPELLCSSCEADLQTSKSFKDRCQQSDKILKLNLRKKTVAHAETKKNEVITVLQDNKLVMRITAPNPIDKILLKCPYDRCTAGFFKTIHLYTHLRKAHGLDEDLEINQQYYCSEQFCVYNINAKSNKFFSGRKFLNQHQNKMHRDKNYSCETCHTKFATETEYARHQRKCNVIYFCPKCKTTYTSNETYLVHLKRKHPNLHAQYKQEKKANKRPTMINENAALSLSNIFDIPKAKKIKLNQAFAVDPALLPTDVPQNVPIADAETTEPEREEIAKDPKLSKITRFPPWELNIDIYATALPSLEYIEDPDAITVAQEECVEMEAEIETQIDKDIEDQGIEEDIDVDEIDSEESKTSEEASKTSEEASSGESQENTSLEESLIEETLTEEHMMIEDNDNINEEDALRRTSATQFPEDITNDVALNRWSNKNDFGINTDESTQTAFDLLSLKSQPAAEEMFFPESVSLSDIQTQTVPLEFGLSQCNKQTQFCTSQTQSPDLSIKETQTCFCLHDSPKMNFKLFDSLSSSPSSNFISTETQTHLRSDLRSPGPSDVMLSFISTETQTCFDEVGDGSL